MSHTPVLIKKIIKFIQLQKSIMNDVNKPVYLDCTFGRGGYTRKILEEIPDSYVAAIDRDNTVQQYADLIENDFGDRFNFFNIKFSEMDFVLKKLESGVDGVVMDLGVSSMQFDEGARGFSFQENGPLDMRMGICQESAFEVVNYHPREKLEDIIRTFGEESRYKNIVNRIIIERKKSPITSTKQLADIVKSTYWHYSKIHPATKTFQAIRIYVNKELEELEKAVTISVNSLRVGGLLIIVSFHSMEDRIVKHFFKSLDSKCYKILTKKPLVPDNEELIDNPRARSAKLRVVERIC